MEQLSELPTLSLRENSGHWFAALLITIAAFGAPSSIWHRTATVAPHRVASADLVANHTSTNAVSTTQSVNVYVISMAHRKRPAVHRRAPRVMNELVNNSTGLYNANYAADARSTNTLDWSCIRNAESHDNYRQVSGAYGVLTSSWNGLGMAGVPGGASIAAQDHMALRIFAMNGHHFRGSWNNRCTMSYGLG
jgi:hypothetical protein